MQAGISTNDMFHTWLLEILNPLNLPTNFLNRIVVSTLDSALRALETTAAKKTNHIYISIFAPHWSAQNGDNWGFFFIGKIDEQVPAATSGSHALDFYLYPES